MSPGTRVAWAVAIAVAVAAAPAMAQHDPHGTTKPPVGTPKREAAGTHQPPVVPAKPAGSKPAPAKDLKWARAEISEKVKLVRRDAQPEAVDRPAGHRTPELRRRIDVMWRLRVVWPDADDRISGASRLLLDWR